MLTNIRHFSTRLLLIILAIMVVIHLVVLALYTQQHRSNQYLANRDAAIQRVMNVIHMSQATPTQQLPKAITTMSAGTNVRVELAKKPAWPTRVSNLNFWHVYNLVPAHAVAVQVSLQLANGSWINITTPIDPGGGLWFQLFLLALEAVIAGKICFYAWSINRFTKPLHEFRKAAERLGVDMQTINLDEYKGPEVVRKTAQAMNKMQQRIQDLLNDRTLMLAAISHDLRTPITRLKLRTNLFGKSDLKQKTVRDLDEMDRMIDEILAFARNDYESEKKSKLELNSLLQTLCDDFADLGYAVTFTRSTRRIAYHGRRSILKRALNNLIENALKYGRSAEVTLNQIGHQINIIITDQGPGIPEDQQESVFSPFYRCDGSRSREVAGTGLGLCVARDSIRAHSGSILLKNRSEGGLSVTVQL